MKLLPIGKVSEMIGVTPKTLREWNKTGKLVPYSISDSGYRYYTQEQGNKGFGRK
ncbi:MerR family DNA-binding transcriptional regulator [Paenibacillus zanthoxyli]|uniref:MerR family DNA-binding transcriptional regulator n=1 Tax=Paenibacillus zanthoxyli TaxID=369399 RepID=UPI000A053C9E